MSDKVREFIEVPQEFFHDGKQVCLLTVSSSNQPLTILLVLDTVYKTFAKGSAFSMTIQHFRRLNLSKCRVHPNLQGSRYWFRRHGFYWLLR